MNDQLHVPAALFPEEGYADNSSPQFLEEPHKKTSSLNQEKYNPANQSMENAQNRQMDDLEAPGRYNSLNSVAGDRVSITGGVYRSICLESLIKFLFFLM